MLEVSGERHRLEKFASKIGCIEHESDVSDLMTFSYFFLGGLLLGQFSILGKDDNAAADVIASSVATPNAIRISTWALPVTMVR